MKKLNLLAMSLLALGTVMSASACSSDGSKSKTDDPELSKVSYACGVLMGQQLKSTGFTELDMKEYNKAIETVLKGGETTMTDQEAMQLIQTYAEKAQARAGEAAMSEGNKFLEENKKKPGVKVTASGLQYVITKEGDGATPTATDEVTVHYTGKLLDGTVFDSSVDRGEPATFPLNRVIPGWTEGLQLMKEGGKYTFFIPSDLAYGPNGIPNVIPPHSTLIFDVELLNVKS